MPLLLDFLDVLSIERYGIFYIEGPNKTLKSLNLTAHIEKTYVYCISRRVREKIKKEKLFKSNDVIKK